MRTGIWFVTGEGAAPYGVEFCCTTAAAGFAGWVRRWVADRPWFDVE